MDVAELLYDSSKLCVIRASDKVGTDMDMFEAMINLVLEERPKVSARAARVVNLCIESNPEMFEPYRRKMIEAFSLIGNESIRFNILHMFTVIPLPEDEEELGMLMNICFDTLDSVTERIAQKVYSLDILARIAMIIPELKHELALIIRKQMPYTTLAFRSRGMKVLKKLGMEHVTIEDDFPTEDIC